MADTNWVCSIGQPNSALTRDGKLWVATSEGLAMLDLPHLPRTNRKPAIYIEEVAVGRNIQPPGHELVLPPGTHHVELHFDAIELSSPEKILLQYRLDSVDSEWLDNGRRLFLQCVSVVIHPIITILIIIITLEEETR